MGKNILKPFKVLDYFAYRTPIMSIDAYRRILLKNNDKNKIEKEIIDFSNKSDVKEILRISSKTLSDELLKNKDNYNDKVYKSLFRYINRMTTRTTPFGLMAGVGIGDFNTKSKFDFSDQRELIKNARPNMSWLMGLIKKIEQDKSISYQLKYTANSIYVENGSRVKLNYVTNYGKKNKSINNMMNEITTSINYNDVVKQVMRLAENGIILREILDILKNENQEIEVEVIEEFLEELIKNEFLISELRIPIVNVNGLEYLIDKLKDKDSNYYKELILLRDSFEIYNKTKVGRGTEEYNNLLFQMGNISEEEVGIQVDLRIKNENNQLSNKVASEVENLYEMLVRICGKDMDNTNFTSYKKDFDSKYGSNTEVPIKELLDNNIGLGAPAGYKKPMSKRVPDIINPKKNEFEKLILNKILKSEIKNNEIVIDKKDIESISNGNELDESLIPDTSEIFAFVSAKSQEDIDSGNFKLIIAPVGITPDAGKGTGRFTHIFNDNEKKRLLDVNRIEKEFIDDKTMVVEINEFLSNGKHGNVASNLNNRDYEITISNNPSDPSKEIKISDIYIGLDNNNKFYLKSKSHNKRLIVKSNNMFNKVHYSNIARFLIEISSENKISLMNLVFTNVLSELDFTPRIRYGKTIIYSAKWKFSKESIDLKEKNMDEFNDKLNKWIESNNLPQFVYITKRDNRILIDLFNDYHRKELLDYIFEEKVEQVVLTEADEGFDNLWLKNGEEKYFSELCIPLVKNKEFFREIENNHAKEELEILKTESIYENNMKMKTEEIETQLKQKVSVEDGWIYYKLYGIEERVEEFLGDYYLELIEKLKRDGDIQESFFIKYKDPDYHIRVRFKADPTKTYSVFKKVNIWIEELKTDGIISDAILLEYNREINRYGGYNLIRYAEKFFNADSQYIANIIKLKNEGNLGIDLDCLLTSDIIFIMESMGIAYEEQKQIFDNRFDKKELRKEFKEKRNTYIKLCNSNNEWEQFRESETGQLLYEYRRDLANALKAYSDQITITDNNKALTNSRIDILFVIIHMHCNRFNGNRDVEKEALQMARHALQSLEYFKKKV